MIVSYFKAQPTEYVMQVVDGKTRRQGLGLSFPYMPLKTNIVLVPTSSMDGNFVFNEVTNNFQQVTIQGQYTYRIANAERAAETMNFTIDARSRKRMSTDLERLPQRVANVIQLHTRAEIQALTLEETIRQSDTVANAVYAQVQSSEVLAELGVAVLGLHFLSITPTPEVGKALEADYRETLLRKADEAIYARREAAVENEQKIQEKQMDADIALAAQRDKLLDLEGANALKEAETRGKATEEEAAYRARALEMELKAYSALTPQEILALGIKSIGDNAQKVGNLTITSEVLAALLDSKGTPSGKS
ncbi:MAG: SPFH domain-containing protein [Fimbriimonadaceae bacterium]|nr:SPFH domain-containing protein [Fimbriimonadaceae bacterium]